MSDINLPEGWRAIKLGDAIEYGKTQKCTLLDVSPDTWILELEDIEKNSFRIIQRVKASARPFKSTKNKFTRGDVLYGKLRPYLNKVVIADDSGVCSTEIIPLKAGPNINSHYLFHWLKSETFLNYVVEVSYGVNMPRLGTKDGLLAPFVLPPLAEQKTIADKLDTLLAQVETTKARLERIPDILKTFRQSVLAAAVSGKLTEEWREGTGYGGLALPLSWVRKRAADVCEKVQSGSTPRNDPFDQNGTIPFLKVYNIVDQKINFDYKPQYVAEKVHSEKLKRSIGLPNDVLMNIVGPPLGKIAVLTDQYPEWNLNQAITLFRPKKGVLSYKYLYFVLCEGGLVRKVMPDTKGSVGQVNISLTQCRESRIPLPPIEEQTQIVHRVEELFAFADTIEQKANAALARVNNLTQSILAKAFRGELTADWRAANPELISGDNSAEALLAKIQAKREALKPAKKPRTKKRA